MTTWTPVPPATRYNGVREYTTTYDNSYSPGPHYLTRDLDAIMGLDCRPVQVKANGEIVERPHLTVPDVFVECDDDGQYLPGAEQTAADQLIRHGWEPLRGYTGQYGASRQDWLMHASEFIGGYMADDIATTPGIYATIVVYPLIGEDIDAEPSEWAVIRRTN